MCFIQQGCTTVAWDYHTGATIHSMKGEFNPMLRAYHVPRALQRVPQLLHTTVGAIAHQPQCLWLPAYA